MQSSVHSTYIRTTQSQVFVAYVFFDRHTLRRLRIMRETLRRRRRRRRRRATEARVSRLSPPAQIAVRAAGRHISASMRGRLRETEPWRDGPSSPSHASLLRTAHHHAGYRRWPVLCAQPLHCILPRSETMSPRGLGLTPTPTIGAGMRDVGSVLLSTAAATSEIGPKARHCNISCRGAEPALGSW